MSTIVTSQSQIPDTPCYVLSNDSFLSGWGWAKGKLNTIIVPCASLAEAQIVKANALHRTDQRRVRIRGNKPSIRKGHLYSLFNRKDESRWYEKSGF